MIVRFGWYPFKCRGDCWSVGFEPLSLYCDVDLVWLSAHPSKCIGDLCCALPLVRGCLCWREELCTPSLYLPKSSVEVPFVGSPVGRVSGNPFVWTWGRRAVCSNLETILVFVFDPLSLTLSLFLILCLALIHIVHSYLYAWYCLCVCAILVLN